MYNFCIIPKHLLLFDAAQQKWDDFTTAVVDQLNSINFVEMTTVHK